MCLWERSRVVNEKSQCADKIKSSAVPYDLEGFHLEHGTLGHLKCSSPRFPLLSFVSTSSRSYPSLSFALSRSLYSLGTR